MRTLLKIAGIAVLLYCGFVALLCYCESLVEWPDDEEPFLW